MAHLRAPEFWVVPLKGSERVADDVGQDPKFRHGVEELKGLLLGCSVTPGNNVDSTI